MPTPSHLLLIEVAKVYDRSAGLGPHPAVAVAKRFGWSRSTTSRRIAAARKAGFLPPPKARRVTSNARIGSHRSVLAEIGRGTSDYRTYRACITCLLPWPCPHGR